MLSWLQYKRVVSSFAAVSIPYYILGANSDSNLATAPA